MNVAEAQRPAPRSRAVVPPHRARAVSPDFRTGEVTAPADHESAPKQLDAPLHVAARLGNTDTVRLLVENGAGPHRAGVQG